MIASLVTQAEKLGTFEHFWKPSVDIMVTRNSIKIYLYNCKKKMGHKFKVPFSLIKTLVCPFPKNKWKTFLQFKYYPLKAWAYWLVADCHSGYPKQNK
jgi:hypothetical protein